MDKKPYSRVYLEITNLCNRSCSFCHGTTRAPMLMDGVHFERAINALRPFTDYLYLHVMGEPLTHPDLFSFISKASALGFKCAITTNGTLLKEKGDALIESGAYKVNVSVHSFENGQEGEYRGYIGAVTDFALKASGSGVLTVLRLWNVGMDGGRNDTTLDLLRSAIDGEWKWGSRGARINHKLHLEYGDRFEWPDMEAPLGDGKIFCYGLSDHFGVLCDGTVIPCCLDSEGTISLGNIFEGDLSDILSSDRAERIRRGFKKREASEELCRRCAYARRF